MKREVPGLEHFVQQRVRKDILQRSAYKVLPSDGHIKLDAMESPYVWPDDFQTEWLSTLREVKLNRYPDSVGVGLCEEIRTWCGLHDSASILLGNGSDECGSGELHLFNPASTTYVKNWYARGNANISGARSDDDMPAGYFNTTTALNAIQFKMSSGNFDGKIKMYGVK